MYNNRRNKTELENKIYRDIQSEIQKYYDKEGIFYKQDAVADSEDTIIEFFSYIYKMIPVTKRKVEYSIELKNKIDSGELSNKHIDILKKYEQAFEEGQNMNIFLSNCVTFKFYLILIITGFMCTTLYFYCCIPYNMLLTRNVFSILYHTVHSLYPFFPSPLVTTALFSVGLV